jgi:hypothetical protein
MYFATFLQGNVVKEKCDIFLHLIQLAFSAMTTEWYLGMKTQTDAPNYNCFSLFSGVIRQENEPKIAVSNNQLCFQLTGDCQLADQLPTDRN